MIELLSPAGSMEKIKYAISYGADAVYVGGAEFSLRRASQKFDLEEIKEAKIIAQNANRKLYIAVNIFAHQSDLQPLEAFLTGLNFIKPDALIIADAGVFSLAKDVSPDIAIHISTQANVTNLKAAKFWASQGAKRITLARELNLFEIEHISKNCGIETEVFVHGAMCLSYSGRCWLSQDLTNRNANHGDCSQSCRWNYALVEEKRPEEVLPVFEDERGTYILSSKDLCLAPEIPDLIKAGVTSFKIEGRMKSVHYIATVTKAYRQIIDSVKKDKNDFKFSDKWLNELSKISHRHYTKGFLGNDRNMQVEGQNSYSRTADFVASVVESSKLGSKIKVKNRLSNLEELEVLTPTGDNKKLMAQLFDDSSNKLDEVHANTFVYIREELPVYSILRRKIQNA